MTSLTKSDSPISSTTHPSDETFVFAQSIENVFRKLIQILIGKISLKKLQEMIQIIFVEETEKKLQEEKPGRNVPLSTLAVVTGFDTRTLAKIKSKKSHLKPLHKESSFLSGITPECSILDIWESNPEYKDPVTGLPKELLIRGPKASFESLVNKIGLTRGVSLSSFLKRLEASNSIIVNSKENSVRMINKRYTPFGTESQTESAKIGMAAVGNLLDTIAHNLNSGEHNVEPFYQQGSWSNRLNRNETKKLRQSIKELLSETDERAREIIMPFEQYETNNDQVTAGISMFYFEEESN